MCCDDTDPQAYETQTEFKWKWIGVGYLCGVFCLTIGELEWATALPAVCQLREPA